MLRSAHQGCRGRREGRGEGGHAGWLALAACFRRLDYTPVSYIMRHPKPIRASLPAPEDSSGVITVIAQGQLFYKKENRGK